jgi:TatD DNase family protein
MVDSHCHLQVPALREGAVEHVADARSQGVAEILVAGILPSESASTTDLASRLGVWCSVGCHPCHVDEWDPAPVLAHLDHPRVVAVGECGLDFYHKPFDAVLQESVFREQIEIARDADLPVILHNRKSNEDLVRVLREADFHRGVFHCFSADRRTLDAALELGFHISISGTVTFRNASIRDLVPLIPSDRLLVETDAPWLAPHPHRGTTNRPALVRLVLEEVALLRGEDPLSLGAKVVDNFHQCFPRTVAASTSIAQVVA